MRKTKKWLAVGLACAAMLCFGACGQETGHLNFYRTAVQYAGENESGEEFLEIAERSQRLVAALEEHAGAFVMDAYNYQDIDGEGSPLYTMNTLHYPAEIDPNGKSVRVSKNYFQYNPIETADGSDLLSQLIVDDLTLNVLVPQQYRDLEDQLVKAWRENFHFEKVEAAQHYNEEAGREQLADIPEEDLKINVIYVKDGQRYFTFRSDCAADTDQWITDPVAQVYTGNVHCNYAHSFLTQWLYFPSDQTSAEAAYEGIRPDVERCGAQESVREVTPAPAPEP